MLLGIGQNEPVGVAKLLHIFAPHYFPLIDNGIGKALGLRPPHRRVSLNANDYLRLMRALKTWLEFYKQLIRGIENKYETSILKLAGR